MRVLLLLTCWITIVAAQQRARVATYNIKFLNANISQERTDRLKSVVEKLDADVIGLQEIDNRAALNKVFDPQKWHLLIDEKSQPIQDVAIVVRKPFEVVGFPTDLNAADNNFLFPDPALNSFFVDRRDVLFAEIRLPGSQRTFFVMVVHAKSRVGGRANTDHRRVGAARLLLAKLEQNFEEKDYVVLGDMNDNPDDESINIIETGNPNAIGVEENTDGPFLINLAETLLAAGHISHGVTSVDIVGDKVNTLDPDSRNRNNTNRGNNVNTGKILFDQLLIPMQMQNKYVQGSIRVFDDKVAVEGGANQSASDHLPVFADFEFDDDAPIGPDVRILSVLPDPIGDDRGREQISVANRGTAAVSLQNWKMRDRAMNVFPLTGSIGAGANTTLTIPSGKMPLNNGGDSIELIDAGGITRHQVEYTAAQVSPGGVITFP